MTTYRQSESTRLFSFLFFHMVQKQTQKCALQSVTCGRFHLRNSMRPQNTATSYLKKKASKQASNNSDWLWIFGRFYASFSMLHTNTHFDYTFRLEKGTRLTSQRTFICHCRFTTVARNECARVKKNESRIFTTDEYLLQWNLYKYHSINVHSVTKWS